MRSAAMPADFPDGKIRKLTGIQGLAPGNDMLITLYPHLAILDLIPVLYGLTSFPCIMLVDEQLCNRLIRNAWNAGNSRELFRSKTNHAAVF